MSPFFKNYFIENFKFKKEQFLLLLLFIPIIELCQLKSTFFAFTAAALMLIAYVMSGAKMSEVMTRDIAFKYRDRDKFLLPLSKYELIMLNMFNSFMASCFFANVMYTMIFITFATKEISFQDKQIIFPVTLLCFSLGFAVSMAFMFGNLSFIQKTKNLIRYLACIFSTAMIGIAIDSYFNSIFTLNKYYNLFLVFSILTVLVFGFIWLNFRHAFFNEHKLYKKVNFLPIIDVPVSILAIGIVVVIFLAK